MLPAPVPPSKASKMRPWEHNGHMIHNGHMSNISHTSHLSAVSDGDADVQRTAARAWRMGTCIFADSDGTLVTLAETVGCETLRELVS